VLRYSTERIWPFSAPLLTSPSFLAGCHSMPFPPCWGRDNHAIRWAISISNLHELLIDFFIQVKSTPTLNESTSSPTINHKKPTSTKFPTTNCACTLVHLHTYPYHHNTYTARQIQDEILPCVDAAAVWCSCPRCGKLK
jgi:hypothetical protein